MLAYIAAKFLLRGVVKSLIINPTISATLSIIPKMTLVNYTMMGHDIILSSNDLLKFGFEKIYEKYGEQELTFSVEKFNNTVYRIYPANELAKRFFKEYSDFEELLVDLDVVGKYLDVLAKEDIQKLNELEQSLFETDEAIIQILHDLNLSVQRASNNTLNSHFKEQQLIDEVMQKNIDLVKSSVTKHQNRHKLNKSGIKVDLPEVPYKAKTDEEKIDEILSKISRQVESNEKVRRRVAKSS